MDSRVCWKQEQDAKRHRRCYNSRLGVDIPDGSLFYPCCGGDTYEALELFLDTVREFNFADRCGVRLPGLECQTGSSSSEQPRRDANIALKCDGWFPKSIIVSSKKNHNDYCPLGSDVGDMWLGNILKSRIWTVNTSYGLTDIIVNCYTLDAVLAFQCIRKLAVFYYRGDSMGEGGSGQWWLGPALFDMVLEKLVDGGLILTDGSNYHPRHSNAPWKELWENNHGRRGVDKPSDFIYKNRQFTCLCQCGHRYGPVYAWQVKKI